MTVSMQAPSAWPFASPVVPSQLMPSGRSYNPDINQRISAQELDVPSLLGFGFYTTGASGPTLESLSDVVISSPANNDVISWDSTTKNWKNSAGGGGGTPSSPTGSVQYNNSGAFGGTSLHYDGTGFSTQYVSTYVNASVLSAAIVNGGTGGTDGSGKIVTGTTGTGTKFQASVTVTGGIITSVDSIAVAGSYTVPPTAPANEPVTGDSLSGAVLSLGMAFSPSVAGSDSSAGLSFNEDGLPGLNGSATYPIYARILDNADGFGDPGFVIEATNNYSLLVVRPLIGTTGPSVFQINGAGGGINAPTIALISQQGPIGAPSQTLTNDQLGSITFQGYDNTGHVTNSGTEFIAKAAEDYTSSANGTALHVATISIGSTAIADRIVIDGSGNTNIQNGKLIVPGAGTPLIATAATATSGAGVGAGTLTNAPSAGNPTSWIAIDDNGVTRYIPAW